MISAERSVVFKKFVEFTQKYNKVYGSMEEFKAKFEIFKSNLIDIVASDDFNGAHTMGITKFADMTREEFRTTYLTLKPELNAGWCRSTKDLVFTQELAAESLDWRTLGAVSAVKDQGQCGSCWAFSAIGYVESQALLQKKTGTFSEQQLVDCDQNGDAGCNGGLMQTAFQYIQANGLEHDSDYPYLAYGNTCTFSKAKSHASVSNVECFEDVTVENLQKMLASQGPLSIAVDANDFQMYSSGVLRCTGQQLDHGVLLVGYTADTWIIKNSWGANWGENGFLNVSNKAGENCAVGAYVAYADVKLN
jgi:C1A family cysteine protease